MSEVSLDAALTAVRSLVERHGDKQERDLMRIASLRITELERESAALRAALQPFADTGADLEDMAIGRHAINVMVSADAVRHARALLASVEA